MLNDVHVEGIVTGRCWAYDDMQFVRIACYPDPGRRPRRAGRNGSGRETPDYITLRGVGQHALALASCHEGDRVQAHGTLVLRDGDISLGSFANKARGPQPALAALRELAQTAGAEVISAYVLIEVLLERLVISERAPRTGDAAPPRGRNGETAGRARRVPAPVKSEDRSPRPAAPSVATALSATAAATPESALAAPAASTA